ncbi:hypothetical protein BTUL_0216g00120 [Botrytis tulipae]|uniref:Uncharacterized protein n=1 Tax=Botrytis tulipae TaxID=87230 RepID=A0A4Z1E842_9HELO|nr:hypothetical protein BTUL_0216g00120 [Botrytis tulipae]
MQMRARLVGQVNSAVRAFPMKDVPENITTYVEKRLVVTVKRSRLCYYSDDYVDPHACLFNRARARFFSYSWRL